MEEYLGDGVYAEFDGHAITLKANDNKFPTDEIYLELEVFMALIQFKNRCEREKENG